MKHTYFGRSRGQRPASYHISPFSHNAQTWSSGHSWTQSHRSLYIHIYDLFCNHWYIIVNLSLENILTNNYNNFSLGRPIIHLILLHYHPHKGQNLKFQTLWVLYKIYFIFRIMVFFLLLFSF